MSLPQVKSLHQRHKSTGNLHISALNNGALRMAAKRTVLGDASNVSRGATAYGEVRTGKAALVSADKYKENRLPAKGQLAHPAQKLAAVPESTAARPAEGFFNGFNPTVTRHAPKKATFVFKDQAPTEHSAELGDVGAADAPAPRHHKSQPQLREEVTADLGRAWDAYRQDKRQCDMISTCDEATEAAYEDAVERQAIEDGTCDYAERIDPPREAVKELTQITSDFVVNRRPEVTALPSPTEQQWYEEEDDYVDVQDAYTTAHSIPCPLDLTTLVAPRETTRVKWELEEARKHVEDNRTDLDVDEEIWDVSMVAEYGEEIFEYLREQEVDTLSIMSLLNLTCQIRMLPDPHYMDGQKEIQWSMRSVLMDWLVQVHQRFNLLPETLFLTVNYIDRFLTAKVVSIGKLQLVGATAILIASKYEEINCPSLQEIEFMVDGGYTIDEILKAERFMLSMLGFELGWPGPMSFLRRVSKADDYDLETRTLAKYFLEVTIMDERFVGSPPSFVAAGAHCLSRMMLKKGEWVCLCVRVLNLY